MTNKYRTLRSLFRFGVIALVIAAISGSAMAQTINYATDFTYQGYVELSGAPVNGTCDFRFELFNDPVGGASIGTGNSPSGVPVVNGVFNVVLDFGEPAFNGVDLFLDISIDCGTGLTALDPRQPITPAPYALGLYGFYTQPNAISPNLVGGFAGNVMGAGIVGGTISGGGASTLPNQITADYSTVSGGQGNTASGFAAAVSGGYGNLVTDAYGTISGGGNNQAGDSTGTTGDAPYATVSGGSSNTASGSDATVSGGNLNTASGYRSVVGGGQQNTASEYGTTVAGGIANIASGENSTVGGGLQNTAIEIYATVGGGVNNDATAWGTTIGGGEENTASVIYATIAGGRLNIASENSTTVGGGYINTASANGATVAGGVQNTVDGVRATVGGGNGNLASGEFATIPGGFSNEALGDASFAAGYNTSANENGSFVWSGSDVGTTSSFGIGTFTARAPGGVRFYSTSTGTTNGVELPTGGGAWASLSDRDAKSNFDSVDTRAVLDTLANIPITTWNYNSQDESIRHMGPVAQDFYAAFGVGEDDRHITTIDADGVALASIQGLYSVVQEQQATIATLEGRIAALESLASGGISGSQLFGMSAAAMLPALLIFAFNHRRQAVKREGNGNGNS